MIDSGVDAASRRKWAAPNTWSMPQTIIRDVVIWTRHQFKQPHTHMVSAMPSQSSNPARELTTRIYCHDDIIICIPQPSMINRVTTYLREFKLQGTLILQAWPSMALPSLLQHTTAAKRLGAAHDVFTSPAGDIPSWPYAMFAFKFNNPPTYARLHSDWSYTNAVYFPTSCNDAPLKTKPPDLTALARTRTNVQEEYTC
eukprot:COSAG05_NODE_822_length_7122_cov_18.423893_6_plen_199_part_00